MDIVIIDGQGGGFGRALIEALRAGGVTQEIVAVGTNALATSAMLRAGASAGAHGRKRRDRERRAGAYSGGSHRPCDGKQHAGRMQPAMARAVAESPAHKVLIPVAKCGAHIAGLPEKPLAQYIADAAELIRGLL